MPPREASAALYVQTGLQTLGAQMQKVKRLIDAGASIPGAIKEALGMPLTEFADKHALPRGTTSEVVNGGRRPTETQVQALIAELGGTPEEWRDLLWRAAKPVHVDEKAIA